MAEQTPPNDPQAQPQQDHAQPWFGWSEIPWHDHRGRTILERVYLGEPPDDAPRFIGVADVFVDLPGNKRVQRRIQFAIEAETVQDAFARMDETARQVAPGAVEQFKQDLQEQSQKQASQLIVPSAGLTKAKPNGHGLRLRH